MRKKVLIIAPFHHGIGGAESYLMGLMEEALKRYDVYLVSLAKPPEKWQGTPIGQVYGICRELFFEAHKYINRVDTVDCHGLQAALVGVVFRWLFKFKFCITMLALYDFKDRPRWFRFICRWILNHADKIFVEGETGKKDLLACGVREDKIIKFMHWVDMDIYNAKVRHDPRINYAYTDNRMNVLFIGRPIQIKGKSIVEKLERSFFHKEYMTFTYIENTPHKDLIKYYQAADILIVPSQYSEGFPRVVFEAAACGCAIIASNRGALPELVEDFGLIATKIRGKGSFREKLLELYLDRDILVDRQKKAHLYAKKYFTPKNAEVILDEY